MLRALALLFAIATSLPAQDRAIAVVPNSDRRVALVIGNGAYTEAPLRNPVNDARAMKAALEACKFEVTLLENAEKRPMEEAIRTFGRRIQGGAVGLFYFVGHGIQLKGDNYLIPIGAKLEQEDEVPYQAVNLGQVLDKMETAKIALNILILDACRNNPFARSWHRGSGEKGLASVNAPTGTLISYATAPGKTAADGSGENGVYTEALLQELKEPGVPLLNVFQRVRQKVKTRSGDVQVPWESNSTVGDFYFRPQRTAEDIAREQAVLADEARRIEAELAKLQADKTANLQRLGAAETQKREQALQEQLRLKGLEEKRLADEGDRRRRLQADAAQLDEAAKAQAAQREQQRVAEEARLAELKRKLEAERTGMGSSTILSLVQARAEVASLTKKKIEVEQRVQAEQIKALATLEADFQALAQKRPNPAPKDEFETMAQYQARLAEHAKAKADLDTRLRLEKESLEARYGKASADQASPFTQQIEALAERKYPVPFTLQLQSYNAEKGEYKILFQSMADPSSLGYRATLKLAPEVARGLKSRAALLHAEGEGGIDGKVGHVAVLDPVLGGLAIQGFQEVPRPPTSHIGMTLAEIPAGSFAMGGSDGMAVQDERPQHRVTVPTFWIGKTTVTQAQWLAVMDTNPSHFKGDNLPVEQVGWGDAKRFIAALNAKETQYIYRLPSEAEWEYACRAGATGERYGDLDAIAWYGSNSGRTTQPVGQKQPNAFGLYDMLGNVWQWCEDNWHDDYEGAPQDGSAWSGSDTRCVIRGGSWGLDAKSIRSALRSGRSRTGQSYTTGFRVVCMPRVTE